MCLNKNSHTEALSKPLLKYTELCMESTIKTEIIFYNTYLAGYVSCDLIC